MGADASPAITVGSLVLPTAACLLSGEVSENAVRTGLAEVGPASRHEVFPAFPHDIEPNFTLFSVFLSECTVKMNIGSIFADQNGSLRERPAPGRCEAASEQVIWHEEQSMAR